MRTMSFYILPFILYNEFKETSDHHTEREDPSMSKRTESVFRRILILFLGMFMILTLFGCQKEEDVTEDVSEDYGGDNETVEDTGPQIDDYPRTKIAFTYSSLYKGLLSTKGTDRIMVIPVETNGGDPMDSAFFERMDLRLNGGFDESYFYSVRKFFQNASYGQLDMQFHIYPTYYYSDSPDVWEQFLWRNLLDAYSYTIENHVKDPSEYDNDKDGYLDGVMFVTNIPSDRHRPNYTFWPERGDEKHYPSNAVLGVYVDVHASELDPYSDNYTDNAVPHELSHAMGLQDYYDYYGMSGVATHFDIMSGVGDWNAYSKMAAGWIDPYVITPDVEKVTIKLRNSAEYPDAILIPCGEWNGTPFDEYLLLDVFADRGNNRQPFPYYYQHGDIEDEGGVRLMHVDARMVRIDGSIDNGLGWLEDFDSWSPATFSDVYHAYDNSFFPDPNERATDAPDKDPNYALLALIPASGEEVENSYAFYASYLFHTGDVFTPEKYSAFFPNYPLSNKYGDIDYRFTVDSFDNETKEAIITIEKIH